MGWHIGENYYDFLLILAPVVCLYRHLNFDDLRHLQPETKPAELAGRSQHPLPQLALWGYSRRPPGMGRGGTKPSQIKNKSFDSSRVDAMFIPSIPSFPFRSSAARFSSSDVGFSREMARAVMTDRIRVPCWWKFPPPSTTLATPSAHQGHVLCAYEEALRARVWFARVGEEGKKNGEPVPAPRPTGA